MPNEVRKIMEARNLSEIDAYRVYYGSPCAPRRSR